jgi:hypothetical protein
MFIPPKHAVEKWAEVVKNKKRKLNKNDRVCERHFNENDIIEFWESRINGQIHRTPRDKPKLRESAIPVKNLSIISQKSPTKHTNSNNKRIHIEATPTLDGKRNRLCDEADSVDDYDVILPEDIIVTETVSTEIQTLNTDVSEEVKEQNIVFFESLYDEAFDVELPSLLWGIHRDSNRKFVAFTEFNEKLLNVSRILYISETLSYKILIDGVEKSCEMLNINETSITEQVSNLLNNLDKQFPL